MNKQKPPGRHHSVPVWLLNRFCNTNGWLWWRRRDWPACKVHKSRPESIFFENNLNTRYAADGSKDAQVEDDLAKLDGKISSITDCLMKQCRQGRSPDLDEESLACIHFYMFVQFKRPSELWKGSGAAHNERVDAILKPSPKVSSVLESKGLWLWSVPAGSALLVGSQPVLRAGPGRRGCLEDPDHGLTLPLAYDVLLGLVPGSSRREHRVLSASEVDRCNSATSDYCKAVAGPDSQVVRRAVAQ